MPAGAETPRPGDFVTVTVTEAHPFFAVADPTAQDYVLRRSRAGDAWDRAQAESCGAPAPGTAGGSGPTSLGMPTLRPRS